MSAESEFETWLPAEIVSDLLEFPSGTEPGGEGNPT
jgi:hypothetical protein